MIKLNPGVNGTFLSLDLDYFGMTVKKSISMYQDQEEILAFIDNLFKLKIPILIVQDHHRIVPYLNKNKYDKIINIDFHSDIVTEPTFGLNEGTWANYYKYKATTIFEWRLPNIKKCLHDGYGVCGPFINDIKENYKDNWHPTQMEYKSVRYKLGLDNIAYDVIIKAAICISPTWYNKKNIDFIFNYFPQLNTKEEKSYYGKKYEVENA